jgi:hypothetical protein
MELADDICDTFRIPPEHQLLIYYVLGPGEPLNAIHKTLDERGVPRLRKLAIDENPRRELLL